MENQDWKTLRRLKTFLWIYLLLAALGLLIVFVSMLRISLIESMRWIVVIWLMGGIGAVFSLIKIRSLTNVSHVRPFKPGDLAYAMFAGPLAWGSFVMAEMQICDKCGHLLYPEHSQCMHCSQEAPGTPGKESTEPLSAKQIT